MYVLCMYVCTRMYVQFSSNTDSEILLESTEYSPKPMDCCVNTGAGSHAVSLPWFFPGSEAGGGAGFRSWSRIC